MDQTMYMPERINYALRSAQINQIELLNEIICVPEREKWTLSSTQNIPEGNIAPKIIQK